ncbi:MAG: hypothetical protein SGJ11_00075 [Phycisphaerae bacterium]|nr:hypothetical protein [Phycisphaerae bacterium]
MHVRSLIAASAACCITSTLFASGPCPCATDLNNDGVTDAPDLAILLGAWGGTGLADFDENGVIDATDLAVLLGAWGPCAPPANDNCAQAKVLSGQWVFESFCNTTATNSEPAFNADCDGDLTIIGQDLWYRYTTPYSGKLIVHTCDSTFDTVLAVYGSTIPGSCACPTNGFSLATLRACDDDAPTCDDAQSFVEFDIAADECLAIRVGGYIFGGGTIGEGPGELNVRAIKTGDRCDIAHELASQTHVEVDGTNAGDTWQQIDQSSCGNGDTIDEWYRFVMPCDGTVDITTCHPGTDFDTTIAVFSDCNGAEIDCNDDSVAPGCQIDRLNRKSTVSISGAGGEVLFIRVSGFAAAVGNFRLVIDVDCLS